MLRTESCKSGTCALHKLGSSHRRGDVGLQDSALASTEAPAGGGGSMVQTQILTANAADSSGNALDSETEQT